MSIEWIILIVACVIFLACVGWCCSMIPIEKNDELDDLLDDDE